MKKIDLSLKEEQRENPVLHLNALADLNLEELSHWENPAIQKTFEMFLKVYFQRVQDADHTPTHIDQVIRPLREGHQVTQTAAIVFIDHLLRQMDIELFEVQMFRSIG